jgi:stringent starvation protein B
MMTTETTSTRPYLIRALYEWCTDNGLTPHLAVRVDGSVQVPPEYVKQGEIVLNISFDATSALKLGDDLIEFKGRFGGVPREIRVPVHQVMAIYARENGQGMSFPIGMAEAPELTKSSLKSIAGVTDPVLAETKRTSNLASVLSVSDEDGTSKSGPIDPPKTRCPRPTLKSVK